MRTLPLNPQQRLAPLTTLLIGRHWLETAGVVAAAALIIFWANAHAFNVPFFGENFQHLGPYRAQGNCLPCLFAVPTLDRWYRPVDAVFTVLSFEVLPLRPAAHHLRNFALLVVNLALFHRFLVEIIPARGPRLLALAFVAVSKVHFTLIGYTNNGAILVTTWLLLSVIFFTRFIKHRRYLDYALALTAAALSMFTKETGVSVFVVLAALLLAYAPLAAVPVRRLAVWLLPVGVLVVAFFVIRTAIAGTPLQTSEAYAPRLSLDVLRRDSLAFGAALANVAFVERHVMGQGSVASYLAGRLGLAPSAAVAADAALVVALTALFGALWARTRSTWRQWLLPLGWMGVVYAMVLTIRNLQMYYTFDFVLTFAVLLATLLVGAARRVQVGALGAIVLIGLNGVVSSAAPAYTFQLTANSAAEATRQVAAVCGRPAACDHVLFVTARVPAWQFVLGGAAPSPPMLPELLGRPDLRVSFRTVEQWQTDPPKVQPGMVVLDIDQGFSLLAAGAAVPPTIGEE